MGEARWEVGEIRVGGEVGARGGEVGRARWEVGEVGGGSSERPQNRATFNTYLMVVVSVAVTVHGV